MLEIIVTGSRKWTNANVVKAAIVWARIVFGGETPLVGKVAVKTGGCPRGADLLAKEFCGKNVIEFLPDEADGANRFRVRNQKMVDSGGTVCLVFANDWASGSGMTARMARKAGIPTFDFGCETGRQQ